MKDWPFSAYDFFGYVASGLVVLVGLQFLAGAPEVLGRSHNPVETLALFLAAYVVGQVVAGLAKPLLEDGIVRRCFDPPSVVLLHPRRRGFIPWLFGGYYTPLPDSVRKKIATRAGKENAAGSGESLFLHVRFHHDLRRDAALMSRLDVFVAQYGFARNLTLALLVTGCTAIVGARVQHSANLPVYGALAVFVGVGMWFRYLKFYRQYSYELFNTYAGGN